MRRECQSTIFTIRQNYYLVRGFLAPCNTGCALRSLALSSLDCLVMLNARLGFVVDPFVGTYICHNYSKFYCCALLLLCLSFATTYPTLNSLPPIPLYTMIQYCWIPKENFQNWWKPAIIYLPGWLYIQKLIDNYVSIIMLTERVQYQGNFKLNFQNGISQNAGSVN